jgi:hypothetical protein
MDLPPPVPEARAGIVRIFEPAWIRDCRQGPRAVTCVANWHAADLGNTEWWVTTRIRAWRDDAGWRFDLLPYRPVRRMQDA